MVFWVICEFNEIVSAGNGFQIESEVTLDINGLPEKYRTLLILSRLFAEVESHLKKCYIVWFNKMIQNAMNFLEKFKNILTLHFIFAFFAISSMQTRWVRNETTNLWRWQRLK